MTDAAPSSNSKDSYNSWRSESALLVRDALSSLEHSPSVDSSSSKDERYTLSSTEPVVDTDMLTRTAVQLAECKREPEREPALYHACACALEKWAGPRKCYIASARGKCAHIAQDFALQVFSLSLPRVWGSFTRDYKPGKGTRTSS